MGKPAFIVPLVVASGLFLENLDGTVLATSLPAMALDLGQDPIQLKLVFTSYLLSLAIFIPISGWCADRFGARNVFRVAMAVFTLGSLGCAFSSSLMEFVVARIIQGLGGAMMTPVGRLIVLRAVPRSELVQAMAWLTIPALIGPVMGPIVGGFITTHFHWRWIFWINLPIGILGIVLASLYIKPSVLQKQQPLDSIGLALSGLGMASVVTGVTIAGQEVLPIYGVVGLILAGLGLLYGYWWHARRLSHAILDMSLFQISSFRSAALGGLVFRIGMGATPFLLPLMLQVGFGMDALQSGLLTFSLAVGAFAMKFSASSILRQFGFRNVLIFNAILGALSLGAMGFIGADTPYGWIYG
ncbi:MAG: MFS transporter, partial [Lutimaribacter sp.]